jgi:hypothetical protein
VQYRVCIVYDGPSLIRRYEGPVLMCTVQYCGMY